MVYGLLSYLCPPFHRQPLKVPIITYLSRFYCSQIDLPSSFSLPLLPSIERHLATKVFSPEMLPFREIGSPSQLL